MSKKTDAIEIQTSSSELASLVELVYVLCTKSRSVLCIPMGIHRNEFTANLNLKEHQFFFTHPVYVEEYYRSLNWLMVHAGSQRDRE